MKHLRQPTDNMHVYGKPDGRKTKVFLQTYDDPSAMMSTNGMEEFIYK